MTSYYVVPGVDTGVRSTANSADVRGNVRVRLAAWRDAHAGRTVGGEAGIVVEEEISPDAPPSFVAIYFSADDLDALIGHLQAMRDEYSVQT